MTYCRWVRLNRQSASRINAIHRFYERALVSLDDFLTKCCLCQRSRLTQGRKHKGCLIHSLAYPASCARLGCGRVAGQGLDGQGSPPSISWSDMPSAVSVSKHIDMPVLHTVAYVYEVRPFLLETGAKTSPNITSSPPSFHKLEILFKSHACVVGGTLELCYARSALIEQYR